MAISRRAFTVLSAASGTSIVVNKPTGTVDGDVMIAAYLHGTGSDCGLTAPNGWTVIGSALVNTELNAKFWYKVASGEGSNYTFTTTTSNNEQVVIIVSYSGCDTNAPINAHNESAPSTQQATLSLSVTTTVADCMLVFISLADTAAAETMTWTGTMTEFQDASYESTFLILGGAEELVTTATGYTRVATKSGTNRRLSGGLFALAPYTGISNISGAGNISSAQAIGSPATAADFSPSGIATAESTGSPATAANFSPSGIATAQAIGSPATAANLSPSGIATAESTGSPATAANLSPSGIATAETLGVPTVSTTGEDISNAGAITSGEALGSPATSANLSASGVTSVEAIGSPITNAGASPSGIVSVEIVGAPTVSTTQYITEAGGIAGIELFGEPAFITLMSPDGLVSECIFGNGQIQVGVLPGAISSAESFGSVAVGNPHFETVLRSLAISSMVGNQTPDQVNAATVKQITGVTT